jgi:TP901 family phage tail tape measure protein
MGVDVDQLNAQLSTIISVTRQAPETVGNALKTIYARISDIESGLDTETTLGDYTQTMKQYGINVLDAKNELRDMGEVMEEVGNKWSSMSREQQVALSQAMAGTRQYNNLLSLFDNWDDYNTALETSKNAVGTLQEQQDTYMESTAAHLQQLSTAQEDLFDSLLSAKDINNVVRIFF